MPTRIEQMYVSPVKSLALVPVERVHLDKPGIAGDRAFFLADARGKLFTQREHPPLVRVTPSYDVDANVLRLTFPDGGIVEGKAEGGEAISVSFFGQRPVDAFVVGGAFGDALTSYCGQPVRLAKVARPGSAFDGYPVSICSMESLGALARAAGLDQIDGRRFRQNIYFSGAGKPHEEDDWIGGEVRVGGAVLRMKMADSRCIVTTRDPGTGEPDVNTLKIIPSYRTDQPKEVNFGVYATVIRPGAAAIGDEVEPLGAAVTG